MAAETLGLGPDLTDWLRATGVRETEALAALRTETAALPEVGHWATPPEEGQIVALIALIAGARDILELGTFTGYGTLWLATVLPEARIVTCERYEHFAAIARRHWQAAGVDGRIDLEMTDAIDLLDRLLAERGEGSFDLVFIDADKRPYPIYYERAVRLVRPGGLVLLDNAFRGGGVADTADTSKATAAIRDVTRTIHADQRVDMATLPVGDGLILARRRTSTP